jgi:uncharacterized membrane protein
MSRPRQAPLVAAGLLMGAGLGGFVDGIVLHQILQWHNMLSNRLPPDNLVAAKVNMYWDGIFHAAVWVLTVVGLRLLWAAGRRREVPWSGRTFGGGLALGWGLFNLIEGVIDHQLLQLHHVRQYAPSPWPWDLAFLGFGAGLVALGGLLIRAGRRNTLT